MGVLKNDLLAKVVRKLAAYWFPLCAAFLSFGLLQIDGIERSFLGVPDREMLQAAFKLRDGVAQGSGDPVLWLDIDYDTLAAHATLQNQPPIPTKKTGPSASIPRELLAQTLAFSRRPSATLVVLDVDIGWAAPDPLGEDKLAAELAAWSADPNAPLLLLAREVLALPNGPTLLSTRFDDIVSAAPNIAFAGVTMLSGAGGAREFVASQCYVTETGRRGVLPSVVSFADAAQTAYRNNGFTAAKSHAKTIKSREEKRAKASVAQCKAASRPTPQNGVISWHIGHALPNTIKAAPVSDRWPGQRACNLYSAPLTASRISFADVMSDRAGASAAPLCGHMVIIGADNAITPDHSATPIGILPGPIILANAMRGHFDTGPIVRGNWNLGRIALQIFLLIATVVAIVGVFDWIAALRLRLEAQAVPRWGSQVVLFVTHPLVFKFIVAFVTFLAGVLVTAVSLELGIWGLLSAPAYFATLYEAGKQINIDRARGP